MGAQDQGTLAVSGLDSTFTLDVTPAKDVIIDNARVVAWDSSLQYNITASASRSGLLSSLAPPSTTGLS